jgi:hypothetical protein
MSVDMRRCPWCGCFGGSHEQDGEAWHTSCWDRHQKVIEEGRKENE